MAGKLYIVSTPIGNLGDMTRRAIEVLAAADYIAAEDTRRTLALLNSLGIHGRLISCHEHSGQGRIEEILSFLEGGADVALCTDAGTPIISDPGAPLTALAAQRGIEIVSVPGACAAIAALTVSAIPAEKFVFEGFLPRDKTRRQAIETACSHPYTTVLYESPHQLSRTLNELAQICPDRRMALCKELTKLHESVLRGSVLELARRFCEEQPRGEYVLVLEGAPGEAKKEISEEEIASLIRDYAQKGMKNKDAAKTAAQQLGINKNRAYEIMIKTLGN